MSKPEPADPDATHADLTDRQIGDFRLLRRLGRGAMADVYLARQDSLRRQVALKVLKRHLATDPKFIARFQREAQAAAALAHANIVQIYDVGCIDGVHFIAQEYVQGQNLRQWLRRNGPPDTQLALTIIRQAAAALAKAAEQGIVHRDIKPENIMLTGSGEVKVADFGLARLPEGTEGVDLTQVGVTLGTPLYMSPEQVEGKPLDPRSDIYALGVTCYHMLCGMPPFQGETVLSVAVQHLKKEPRPLADRCPHLPEDLCRIVHKMLAKDPQARYQSAAQLSADLRRLQSPQSDSEPRPDEIAVPEQAVASTTQRLQAMMNVAGQARGRRLGWGGRVAAALAAFAVGAAAALLATRDRSSLAEFKPDHPPIPQQDSVLRQWYYAAELGTEDAWWSVIEYFPEKTYMVFRAKQQLARIFLRQGRYEEATALFEEFTFTGQPGGEMHAFGLAGQCGVLTIQGRYQESATILAQLWPIRSQLRDPQMRQMLSHVVRKNRSELGSQTTQDWETWLSDQFRDGG